MDGMPIWSKDMWNADIFGNDIGQVGGQRCLSYGKKY